MTARSTVARDQADARRYRMLRVEMTELRDDLAALGQFELVNPGPIVVRIRRALDRAAFVALDEPVKS